MSITLKSILALGLFTVVAACAQQEEAMDDDMSMEEPMVMEKDHSMDKM